MLDWVPAQLRVIRICRPKYGCRTCGTVCQAPAPERPIAGGLATPALLAQVLVSKYCDHTPLYRQSQIFAHHGVELDRSTLAGWVGGACWWPDALHERLCKDVFASDHLFADDTSVPVLEIEMHALAGDRPGRHAQRFNGLALLPRRRGYILGKSGSGGTGSVNGRSSLGCGSGGSSTGGGLPGSSGGGLVGFGSLLIKAQSPTCQNRSWHCPSVPPEGGRSIWPGRVLVDRTSQ